MSRVEKNVVPKKKKELKLNIKQLIAPKEIVETRRKSVAINDSDKSDIKLRKDLLEPTEMLYIKSSSSLKTQSRSADRPTTKEDREFKEMVMIGRPERDTTLKQPLLKNLNSLRRYKMGLSPALKTDILRETLAPQVTDISGKYLLSELTSSKIGSRKISLSSPARPPLLEAGSFTDSVLDDECDSPVVDVLKLRTDNHLRSASSSRLNSGAKTAKVREGPNVNLYLYHLSRQGTAEHRQQQQSAKSQRLTGGAAGTDTGAGKEALMQPSIDDSVSFGKNSDSRPMSSSRDNVNLGNNLDLGPEVPPVKALYNPATVRLPQLGAVPGFGAPTNPLVERGLGAYRVHNSAAVSAAAALDEVSTTEQDSYQADRREKFFHSASLASAAAAAGSGAGSVQEQEGALNMESSQSLHSLDSRYIAQFACV
jgi:hypothetical protein